MNKRIKEANHRLIGGAECREAVSNAKVDDPVILECSGRLLRFLDTQGRLLGTLTSRHSVAKELDAGQSLLHCSISWIYEISDAYPNGVVSARIATGDPDDEHAKWMAKNVWGKAREVRQPAVPKAYPVNLVGESFHQDAIHRCRDGDEVTLYREANNPHDARALVVKTRAGQAIGYIGRDSWLQRAIHEDQWGAKATILRICPGRPAAVVLEVTLSDDHPIGQTAYPEEYGCG